MQKNPSVPNFFGLISGCRSVFSFVSATDQLYVVSASDDVQTKLQSLVNSIPKVASMVQTIFVADVLSELGSEKSVPARMLYCFPVTIDDTDASVDNLPTVTLLEDLSSLLTEQEINLLMSSIHTESAVLSLGILDLFHKREQEDENDVYERYDGFCKLKLTSYANANAMVACHVPYFVSCYRFGKFPLCAAVGLNPALATFRLLPRYLPLVEEIGSLDSDQRSHVIHLQQSETVESFMPLKEIDDITHTASSISEVQRNCRSFVNKFKRLQKQDLKETNPDNEYAEARKSFNFGPATNWAESLLRKLPERICLHSVIATLDKTLEFVWVADDANPGSWRVLGSCDEMANVWKDKYPDSPLPSCRVCYTMGPKHYDAVYFPIGRIDSTSEEFSPDRTNTDRLLDLLAQVYQNKHSFIVGVHTAQCMQQNGKPTEIYYRQGDTATAVRVFSVSDAIDLLSLKTNIVFNEDRYDQLYTMQRILQKS